MKNPDQTTTTPVSPINRETLGIAISEELSLLLRKYTNKNHRADVSQKTGLGTSTIRDLVFRNNSLTINNSIAIISLINIAVNRCKEINEDSETDELDLLDYIKKG